MGQFDSYAEKTKVDGEDLELIADSQDLDGDGDETTKKSKVINRPLPSPDAFMQIDGDFNGNQSGNNSQSSSGYDVFDMYRFANPTTATLTRQAHLSTNSKPYFARIDVTVAGGTVELEHRLKGNIFSGETYSFMIRAKYNTNKPSTLRFRCSEDGGTFIVGNSFDLTDLTTNWNWLRIDNVFTDYSVTDFTELSLQNFTSEVWDLDIDKIRIVLTSQLPKTGIPEWIKQDERDRNVRVNRFQYFRLLDSLTSGGGFRPTFVSTDDIFFFLPYDMIDTVSFVGTANTSTDGYYIRSSLTDTSVQTGFSFAITKTPQGVRIIATKASHGFTEPLLIFRGEAGIQSRY
ncbi:MAG: hypothetical protein R3250_04245 [Melioribacteraceae bacterium]|nr:hypothetical protein [Melioribacteraceae bacterium]